MKEEDVKYGGQELGQVPDDQFNSGEGSPSVQAPGVRVGYSMLHRGAVTWHQR